MIGSVITQVVSKKQWKVKTFDGEKRRAINFVKKHNLFFESIDWHSKTSTINFLRGYDIRGLASQVTNGNAPYKVNFNTSERSSSL